MELRFHASGPMIIEVPVGFSKNCEARWWSWAAAF